MRLDASQLDVLERLGKSPDGRQLLALISAEIADCNATLRKATGESLYRAQGVAQYLDELRGRLEGKKQTAQLTSRRPTPFDSTA
jgi:hypothetical protein